MKKNEPKPAMKNEFNNFLCCLIKFLVLILFSFANITIVNAQWEKCPNEICSNVTTLVSNENNIYAGSQSCGILMSTDNGDNWTFKNNGITKRHYVDPNALDISSLAINGNNMYVGTFFSGIFLSTDKGDNWVQKSNGLPYDSNSSQYDVAVNSILINGNKVFAGTSNGVYLSTDNGDNWISKNYGLTDFDTDVSSIAISGNNIFAGSYRGGVLMTTDNGDSWIEKNNGLTNLHVWALAIKGNNIYAGTEGGLFLSTDNGSNWKIIGFKDTTIETLFIKGDYIFAAFTGWGIYLSTDNGNSWTAKNSGLTYLDITSIIINGDYIFAGTFGYGVDRAKLSDLGITDVKETEQKIESIIYPNPASDLLFVQKAQDINSKYEIKNLLGSEVMSGEIQGRSITINTSQLPQGLYFLRIGNGTRKFIKE
jgi:hypothetical protein